MIPINPDALSHDYIPRQLPYREKQFEEIRRELSMIPIGLATHLLIIGPTGTGKTVTVKKALQTSNVPHIYIVAETNAYATLVKLTESAYIGQRGKSKRRWGLSFGLVWQELDNLLPKPVVIVIDEAEKFIVRDERSDELLYYLSRRPKTYTFLISNKLDLMDHIRDTRVKSSFKPRVLVFPRYNAEELETIIRHRLTEAIGNDYGKYFSEAAIRYIAGLAAKVGGDARYAIDIIRESIRVALSQGKSIVEVENVKEAVSIIEYQYVMKGIYTLPHSSLILLYIVCVSKDKRTVEIYRKYNEIVKKEFGLYELSERRLRDMLAELEQLGFVNVKRIGRTYVVVPSKWINKKVVEEIKRRLFGA